MNIMFNSLEFVHFFETVESRMLQKYPVSPSTIQSASLNVVEAYLPLTEADWNRTEPRSIDYNHMAHRCAYLHKYAPLHSCLVHYVLSRALEEAALKAEFSTRLPDFKICSLGGGPGNDVFGTLSSLRKAFGIFQCTASVLDMSRGWAETLGSALEIIRERGVAGWGPDHFRCTFIEANLLNQHHPPVNQAIGTADLVNMVKFLSSVPCKGTEKMVKKIFHSMRPGAFLLFIDNASGGYSQLMSRVGQECQMQSVFGPLEHIHYADQAFGGRRYGSRGCSETRVSVHLLMKPKEKKKRKKKQNSQTHSSYQRKRLSDTPLQHLACNKRRKLLSSTECIDSSDNWNGSSKHQSDKKYGFHPKQSSVDRSRCRKLRKTSSKRHVYDLSSNNDYDASGKLHCNIINESAYELKGSCANLVDHKQMNNITDGDDCRFEGNEMAYNLSSNIVDETGCNLLGTGMDRGGWNSGTSIDRGGWNSGTSIDRGGWNSGTSIDRGGWNSGTSMNHGGWNSGTSMDHGGWNSSTSMDHGGWNYGTSMDRGAWNYGTSMDRGAWNYDTSMDRGAWNYGTSMDRGAWNYGTSTDRSGWNLGYSMDSSGWNLRNHDSYETDYNLIGNCASASPSTIGKNTYRFCTNNVPKAAVEFRGSNVNTIPYYFGSSYNHEAYYNNSQDNNAETEIPCNYEGCLNASASSELSNNINGDTYELPIQCDNGIDCTYWDSGANEAPFKLQCNQNEDKRNISAELMSNSAVSLLRCNDSGQYWKDNRSLVVKFNPFRPAFRKVLLK